MRTKIALVATILVASVTCATAQATITDPRKCDRPTAGDQALHGYWCAKWAAIATVRTVMSRRQHVARWYPAVYCDQNGSLLRWTCQTFLSDHWRIAVTWKATSTGWHRYVTVTQTH